MFLHIRKNHVQQRFVGLALREPIRQKYSVGTVTVATLRRRIIFFCDFQDFVLCSDISWYKIRNSLRSQFHLDSSMGITSAIDDEISGQTSAMAHQFEKE